MTQTQASEVLDGRRARSDRTRIAIVDALLELLTEGHLRPSAEKIAERAGISRRALFNHFRDVEDLLAQAAQRRFEQILPTLRPLPTEGSLPERARAAATMLCGLYERVAPVRRAALHGEPESKVVAERMTETRRMHRASVEAAFARELAACPATERKDLAAMLAGLTGFVLWDELTTKQGLPPTRVAAAIERQILAALSPVSPAPARAVGPDGAASGPKPRRAARAPVTRRRA